MAKKTNPTFNNPTYPIIDFGVFIQELITFIENKLYDFPRFFRNSHFLQNLPKTIEGENTITENLCSCMMERNVGHIYNITNETFYHFDFINQTQGEGHRSYDIGVSLIKTGFGSQGKFFVIEAKRLPTPGTGREKEYVTGNLGAIERFKKEVHGQELRNNISAIVGYVQTNTAQFWHDKVNSWIEEQIETSSNPDLTWTSQDKLTKDANFQKDAVNKYTSKNKRINMKDITLLHYWMQLK
ncbi:MAG: hypothetical protein EAZ53_05205 [Bacteroidetes bacterium]|nr:MAG: hypothetical protein EAZ53_05205 [Bacteroidota bacterium]